MGSVQIFVSLIPEIVTLFRTGIDLNSKIPFSTLKLKSPLLLKF